MPPDPPSKSDSRKRIYISEISRRSGLPEDMVLDFLNRCASKAGMATLTADRKQYASRIQNACRDLGYVPRNPLCRVRLYPEKADIVFLMGNKQGLKIDYFIQMFQGLSEMAEEEGIKVKSGYFDLGCDYGSAPDKLPPETTDGITNKFVIAGQSNASLVEQLLKLDGNVVFLSRASGVPGTVSVVPDYRGAAKQAIQLLYAHGHRSIAIAGARYAWEFGYNVRELLSGAKAAAAHFGFNLSDEDIFFERNEDTYENPGFLTSIRSSEKQYTAVFCLDDTIANSLYMGAANLNISIPGDLSLVGCNNESISQKLRPRLSTVHVPLFRLGREVLFQAMEMVLNGQPENAKVVTMPTSPILRDSIRYL